VRSLGLAGILSVISRSSPEALRLVGRLLREQAPLHFRSYALVLLCMIALAALTAAPAYLFGKVINEVYLSRDVIAVMLLSAAIIAVFTGKGIAAYFQAILLARITNRIVAYNQEQIFRKLIKQPIGFFSDKHSSEFGVAIGYAPLAAATTLNIVATSLGRDLLSVISLSVVMVSQAPFLSLIAILVFPPALISVRKIIKHARRVATAQLEGGAMVQRILQEALQGYKVVRTYNLENEMVARVVRSTAAVERASNNFAQIANRASPLMESLGGIAVSLVVMYTGYQVLVLDYPPGQIVAFITAFLLAYEPGKRLARISIDLNAASVGLETLYSILDLPPEPDDGGKPRFVVGHGKIEFKQVSFEYRPGAPVLNQVSFSAEPRRVTALVGPSGGGKTTILNLLLRLYDNYSGSVVVDGHDIRQFTRASVRDGIAYVGQETFLFPGSVRENIEKGKPGATEAEIVAAARAAFAEEFIARLPNGYDTPVGENGVQLSGGQRQRIAIARALIRDARIILLDEPTAALDGEAEHHVRAALAHLLKNRTTILIAHGLHSVAHADKIYVLEAGRVIEEGEHATLLRRPSRYRALFELQQSAKIAEAAASG
jgi:ABC-type multidrug transport system fused ATPase/permease subunit